jgi:phosphoribosylamine--glycine ligase
MKVLVIGSGGREHAICWRLRQSPKVTHVFCAPGNVGIGMSARCLDVAVDDIDGLVKIAKDNQIDLTVVGPELPLSLGVVDRFQKEGLRIFGASKEASMLESSKAFAKQVMNEAGVATGRYEVVNSKQQANEYLSQVGAPIVLKADGLAAGKGVFVCHSVEEAKIAIESLYSQSNTGRVVCEEFLEGIEISYMIATDGENIVPMATSHDYKRIFDNDEGPNTGGMGSVCPTPRCAEADEEFALYEVMVPTIKRMKERGTPFTGFLYAGLMKNSKGEIKVLEFNTRLGDPETQSIMRACDGDLASALLVLAELSTKDNKVVDRFPDLSWSSQSVVSLVLAAEGYPDTPKKGDEITGITLAENIPGVVVFHAGTVLNEGKILTNGGRVLAVSAMAETLQEATANAYRAADMIQFRGRHLRRDIGAK